MEASYNLTLVGVSFVIAIVASYTALSVATRISLSSGLAAFWWVTGGAFSMGIGIWAMHFVGMLAFHLPIPLAYDISLTALSIVPAVVASAIALNTLRIGNNSWLEVLPAGLLMGLGISAMHYLGMEAMQMSPPIRYDTFLFALSIVIAVVASVSAIRVAFYIKSREFHPYAAWLRLLSALVMALAIVGMHYTGMAAAQFDANAVCLAAPQGIDTEWLTLAVGGGSFAILGITLIVSVYDARAIQHNEQLLERYRLVNQELQARGEALAQANKELNLTLERLQQTQAQLVQAEKMASLGGLVAGISHEINTPLGVSITSASVLEESLGQLNQKLQDGSLSRSAMVELMQQSDESLHILLQNLQLAANLVNSFKQVAVDQASDEKRHINLHTYIDEVLLSLRPRYKRRPITLKNLSDQHIDIITYPGAIWQIISNLVMNSLTHAFAPDQPGEIIIEAHVDQGQLNLHYRDNGKGIDAQAINRVFEPFYTTDRSQGGRGLGLNIVYNLVTSRLQGKIVVSSPAGSGLQFAIELPQATD